MKFKSFGGGYLFLSFISLISVGFSAWNIGGVASTDITISADDIQTYNIITIGTPNYSFKIGQDGLVVDHSIVSNATMSFPFSVDNGLSQSYIKDNSLKVTVTLTAIENVSFIGLITNVTSNTGSVSTSNTTPEYSIRRTITFIPSDKTTTDISITYTVTDSSNAVASFYNKLPSFSFTASLEVQ